MKTIRTLQLHYTNPQTVVMPKKLEVLGIAAQLDPAQANIKPRLVYVEDSQFPQRVEVTYLLLRGQADVEAPNCKNFKFIALTYDQNRRHNGIATLWQVDQVKDIVIEKPIVKPRHVEKPSPESLAAIKAHEEKVAAEKERLAEIEETKNPIRESMVENIVDFDDLTNKNFADESCNLSTVSTNDAFAGLEEDVDIDELDKATK